MADKAAPRVLCVDDDRDIAEIVQAVLSDEGYQVSCLYELADDALMRTVGQLEPDCVLLDGGSSVSYEKSWADAAALALRGRSIPVIMFSAHPFDTREAREGTSDRANAAHFAAVLDKPFSIDDLLSAVSLATGESVPFDRSSAGEEERTRSLAEALTTHGATDVQTSPQREWATFRDKKGRMHQLYWWQQRGVYQVGRFDEAGNMKMVGQFIVRDAAIAAVLPH